MTIKKISRPELVRQISDLSLPKDEVYILETNINPYTINLNPNSKTDIEPLSQICVPQGRLLLPIAYDNTLEDGVEMWSIFTDKFKKNQKIVGEMGDSTNYHTDWQFELSRDEGPLRLEHEARMNNFTNSLTNNYNILEESQGINPEAINGTLDKLINKYFIARARIDRGMIDMERMNAKMDNEIKSIETIANHKDSALYQGSLNEFQNEIETNIMSYFTPK